MGKQFIENLPLAYAGPGGGLFAVYQPGTDGGFEWVGAQAENLEALRALTPELACFHQALSGATVIGDRVQPNQALETAYRPDWWPTENNDHIGVLELALKVKMDSDGSGCLGDAESKAYRRALRWVVANWSEPTSKFDHHVKGLCETALAEKVFEPDVHL